MKSDVKSFYIILTIKIMPMNVLCKPPIKYPYKYRIAI